MTEKRWEQLEIRGESFRVRREPAGQDETILREVFEEDCYGLRAMAKHETVKVVVDIGAHVGGFTRLAAQTFPGARLYSIEPNPSSADVLRTNTEHLPSSTVIASAVVYDDSRNVLVVGESSTGGSMVVSPEEAALITSSTAAEQGERYSRIVFEPDGSVHSSHDPAGANERYHETQRVEGHTLEQILDEYHIDHIDLLKLDCEGAEITLLNRMEDSTAERIGMLVGEYHLGGGAEAFRELLRSRFPDYDIRVEGTGHLGMFHAAPRARSWWKKLFG